MVCWKDFGEIVLVSKKTNTGSCVPFLPPSVALFLAASFGNAANILFPQGEGPENRTDVEDSRVGGGRGDWADGITEPLIVYAFHSM